MTSQPAGGGGRLPGTLVGFRPWLWGPLDKPCLFPAALPIQRLQGTAWAQGTSGDRPGALALAFAHGCPWIQAWFLYWVCLRAEGLPWGLTPTSCKSQLSFWLVVTPPSLPETQALSKHWPSSVTLDTERPSALHPRARPGLDSTRVLVLSLRGTPLLFHDLHLGCLPAGAVTLHLHVIPSSQVVSFFGPV